MNELEDEPIDVQRATPVRSEIKVGQNDPTQKTDISFASKRKPKEDRARCPKEKTQIPRADCCEAKRRRRQMRDTVEIFVHQKPCKQDKYEIIPRQCLTHEEYTNFLAEPIGRRKCNIGCEMKKVRRKLRPIPPRIVDLSKPMRRRLMMTLEERGFSLSPEKLFNIVQILEGESAMSPEQAENFVRDREELKKAAASQKKKPENTKCHSKVKQTFGAGDPSLDLEVANCQYDMALRFVRSIFDYKCTVPREEYKDISDVVLCRLSKILEYSPIGNEDRKSQQMRILADIVSCWIAEILVCVAGNYKDDLEDECWKRRREIEELAALESLQTLGTQSDYDRDSCQDEVDLDDDEARRNQATDSDDLGSICDVAVQDDYTMRTATCALQAVEEEPEPEEDDKSQQVEMEETVDDDVQAEPVTCDAETEVCEEEEEVKEMKVIACKISSIFCPDIPFLTLARIFETIYCMIECEFENTLEDPMDNRIHRVIYEKFEYAIRKENPELLTERMKDILDVIAGKIAKWIRTTLTDSQVCFLENNPPEVESREIRDWSKWVANIVDMAEDWTSWINRVTKEANCMKKTGQMTRGEWQHWTSKFEKNAMLWRRTYLEAVHQQHHNTMMMTCRKIIKTGDRKRPPCPAEKTINFTNFESVSRLKDDC